MSYPTLTQLLKEVEKHSDKVPNFYQGSGKEHKKGG